MAELCFGQALDVTLGIEPDRPTWQPPGETVRMRQRVRKHSDPVSVPRLACVISNHPIADTTAPDCADET